MDIDFKPSDVVLGYPPLIGTMGKAEIEVAVAVVIRCLVLSGDTWTISEDALVAACEQEDAYLSALQGNPFLQPDFFAAEKAGYITKVDGGLRLTEKALGTVRKYARVPLPPLPTAEGGT